LGVLRMKESSERTKYQQSRRWRQAALEALVSKCINAQAYVL
jgi:hypothetical protein